MSVYLAAIDNELITNKLTKAKVKSFLNKDDLNDITYMRKEANKLILHRMCSFILQKISVFSTTFFSTIVKIAFSLYTIIFTTIKVLIILYKNPYIK